MSELCERIDVIARRWHASALGVYEHVQFEDGGDNSLVYGWDEEDGPASLVLDPSCVFRKNGTLVSLNRGQQFH